MGRFPGWIRIRSILLYAAIAAAAGGTCVPAQAQNHAVTDATGNVTSNTVEQPGTDFGGTPSAVESLSTGTRGSPSLGTAQRDQVSARNAVERGEVLPFGSLLKKVRKAVPGDVVKVRLKRSPGGNWFYDVTVLNASGRYVQVSLNAATGNIVSTRYR